MGQGKLERDYGPVTPHGASMAMLQAHQDAKHAGLALAERDRWVSRHRGVDGNRGLAVDVETTLEVAAVSLAAGICLLSRLRRHDKRFDFGVIHQQLLEYLPTLVVADPVETKTEHMRQLSAQLELLAHEIMRVCQPVPKPLDFRPATKDD